jgi:hypothetical protein
MNAPERHTLDKPMPLIIALVGDAGAGRKTVAKMLKHKHGFAVASFRAPLAEAVASLYGVSPADFLFDPAKPLQRYEKSPNELVEALRVHTEEIAGADFLTRRLVERTVARGEWQQQDLVIHDLASPEQLQWLRLVGGIPMWIRKPAPIDTPEMAPALRLAIIEWRTGDLSVLNDGSLEALAFKVDSLIERARAAAAITP